jgi:hypothetical protein
VVVVHLNGSDRVWPAINGRVIAVSGTRMAAGNQRAALINKQMDGVKRGETERGRVGWGVTHHFIIHSHAVT